MYKYSVYYTHTHTHLCTVLPHGEGKNGLKQHRFVCSSCAHNVVSCVCHMRGDVLRKLRYYTVDAKKRRDKVSNLRQTDGVLRYAKIVATNTEM